MYSSNFTDKELFKNIVSQNNIECLNYSSYENNIRISLISQNIQLKKIIPKKKITTKFQFTKPQTLNIKQTRVPYGYFYYPIDDNIVEDNNYELKYYENIPDLEKYHDALSYVDLDNMFTYYPTRSIPKHGDTTFVNISKEKKCILKSFPYPYNIKKYFIIWWFIKSLLTFYEINIGEQNKKDLSFLNEKNIYQIIFEISSISKIPVDMIYYIISYFLFNIKKYTNFHCKKNIGAEKFQKFFCQFCLSYCCHLHFYNSVWKTETENNIKIMKSIPTKISGDNIYIEDNEETKLEYELKNRKCIDCQNSEIRITDEKRKIIFKGLSDLEKIEKHDLYIIYILGNNKKKYFLNPCFVKNFLYKKYSCDMLQLIISKFKKDDIWIVKTYLSMEKFGGIAFDPLSDNKSTYIISSNKKIEKIEENNEKNIKNKTNQFYCYKPCTHPGDCIDCECAKQNHCDKFCICAKSKKNCKFLKKGCLCKDNCISNCKCKLDSRECDRDLCQHCKGGNCDNMKLTLRKYARTFYGESLLIPYGGGLFAGENIKKGNLIGEYFGEKMEKLELARRSIFSDVIGKIYPFDSNNIYDIDSVRLGNLVRFINHSDFGYENVEAKKFFADGEARVGLFAMYDIKKDEELYFNYNIVTDEDWLREYNEKYHSRKK